VSVAIFFFLLATLIVSSFLLLGIVAAVWWFDRYDREPLHLVAMEFLWGATVAPLISVMVFTFFAGLGGDGASQGNLSLIGVSAFGPLVEEVAKGIGLLLVVLLSSKFDNPTDGVVYGTAVGLGFAVTENVIYGLGAGLSLDGPRGILLLVGGRTLLSAGIHALCSATLGGFLGHALLSRRSLQRAVWSGCGLAVAVALHTAWNVALVSVGVFSINGSPRLWLVTVPLLYGFYVATLAAFLHSEHGIIKRQLAEEVDLGVAPPWVLEIIPYYRRRIRGDWWPSRRERTVIARLLTRVAFRKHALRHLPRDEATIASLEVVQLRRRVREILGSPPEELD
jgi:RsiW-degrading membrane proteinase PrsW (M82 family)